MSTTDTSRLLHTQPLLPPAQATLVSSAQPHTQPLWNNRLPALRQETSLGSTRYPKLFWNEVLYGRFLKICTVIETLSGLRRKNEKSGMGVLYRHHTLSTCQSRIRLLSACSLCILVEGAMKRAKIARNTHMAPPGSKIVLMSQVLKQTLAKTSDKLTGSNIKIHRCSDAFIYLLSPLR